MCAYSQGLSVSLCSEMKCTCWINMKELMAVGSTGAPQGCMLGSIVGLCVYIGR